MAAASNRHRIQNLEAALAAVKQRDRWSLGELAALWGVTTPRFVTVRNQMAGFPDAVTKDGNKHIFMAKPAIQAMLRHEQQGDKLNKARSDRAAAILGKRRRGPDEDLGAHSPNELATLSRLAAEAEERERAQGLYIPAADVHQIAGDVFAEISDFASRLSNEIDPHGQLDAEIRTMIDKRAKDALQRCHRQMKKILDPDAQPAGDRGTPGRTGRTSSRRKSG